MQTLNLLKPHTRYRRVTPYFTDHPLPSGYSLLHMQSLPHLSPFLTPVVPSSSIDNTYAAWPVICCSLLLLSRSVVLPHYIRLSPLLASRSVFAYSLSLLLCSPVKGTTERGDRYGDRNASGGTRDTGRLSSPWVFPSSNKKARRELQQGRIWGWGERKKPMIL